MAEVAGMEAREWLNGRAEGYGKCGAAAARVAGRFFCEFSKICSDRQPYLKMKFATVNAS